ncbi:MAG: DUF2279 domain-containing protein [Desulfuromonadales bacterium]|nr:DUF2279 domain-containing protein [Desulfuromonadales bacterium]
MYRLLSIILVLAFLLLPTSGVAEDRPDVSPDKTERRHKTLLLNTAVGGGILAWGAANWNYFQRSPRASREDWFGHATKDGGADKIGHLYATYIIGRAFRKVYLDWGHGKEQADRLGTFSSLGVMTLMEVGDSFSRDYGFSYEDMLMNLAGAGFGYLLATYPDLDRKLDLRAEYLPRSNADDKIDIVTAYEHLKFLLALKAEGFDSLASSWLKYLELHLGYYTRNYDGYHPGDPDRRERTLYAGLGVNVGKLLERWVKVPVFDYLQLPYSYLPLEKNFD